MNAVRKPFETTTVDFRVNFRPMFIRARVGPRTLASRRLWRKFARENRHWNACELEPFRTRCQWGRGGGDTRIRKPERSTLPAADYVGIFGRRIIIINRNHRRRFFCFFGVFFHIAMSSKQQPVVTHYNDISYYCRDDVLLRDFRRTIIILIIIAQMRPSCSPVCQPRVMEYWVKTDTENAQITNISLALLQSFLTDLSPFSPARHVDDNSTINTVPNVFSSPGWQQDVRWRFQGDEITTGVHPDQIPCTRPTTMLCVLDTIACPPSRDWKINRFQNGHAIRLLWGHFQFWKKRFTRRSDISVAYIFVIVDGSL